MSRLDELEAKARKELDYDDDGDFDANDLRTKGGKRLIVGLIVALLVLLAIAFASDGKASEDGVAIPVDCGQTVCVMPKKIWEAVMQGHNALVDENRNLKAELAKRQGCGPLRGT